MRWARLAACAALSASAAGATASDEPGVVVVGVRSGLAAEKAGLRPGDRLLRWEQAAEIRGELRSPFDLMDLEVERGPRGPLTLVGTRGGEPLSASLFPDDWGLEVRPELSAALLALYEDARRKLGAGEREAGLAGLRELSAGLSRASGPPDARLWALLATIAASGTEDLEAVRQAAAEALNAGRPAAAAQMWAACGRTLLEAERNTPAQTCFKEALAVRSSLDPGSLATAALWAPLGLLAYRSGLEGDEEEKGLAAAQALLERVAPRSLALARILNSVGWLSFNEGPPFFERAVAIAADLAPDSLLLATFLNGQAWWQPDPTKKLELARRAAAIQERLEPDGLALSRTYRTLGGALQSLGDPLAKEYAERSLAITERLVPGTLAHSNSLNHLAIYWVLRGNLADAERLYRAALEVTERAAPDSFWLATRLYNLGELLSRRHEFDQAEQYLKQGMALAQRIAPGGDLPSRCLMVLGRVARDRGDSAAAEEVLRRALADSERTHGGRPAMILVELGEVLGRLGRLEEAEQTYREALAAHAQQPADTMVAQIHTRYGDLQLQRSDLEAAEREYAAALALWQERAPGSAAEAEASHPLGVLALRRGDTAAALARFTAAVDSLDAQLRQLGGSADVQASFRARYVEYYRDLEDLLLQLGRPRDAFAAVERSRARSLLALLASRDLNLDAGLPETLAQERRQADVAHDGVLRRLARLGPSDDKARAQLRLQLEEAQRRQEDVRLRIRSAAPRQAALRDPQPLDLAAARGALEPGTLVLAYSFGPSTSRLYAIGPGADDFAVHDLRVSESRVRADVARFRELIDERRGPMLRQALDEQSRALGRLLLGPVARSIAAAGRILVVPDGVLHLLPFAALRDPADSRGLRYLIEAKPLHVVSSLTLYAQLAAPRAQAVADDVAGFGDPFGARSEAPRDTQPSLKRALKLGLRFEPLPAAHRELAALKTLSPRAHIWLGRDATEERAKAVGRSTRILHFATHGFVDEDFPLESGLALSPPDQWTEGKDNGLLQAWEIFESVRLDADLVTLSACETALGKEVAGEGLLGLTWAFQYAGARRVLASLWEVNDAATGELISRFYAYLRAGVPSAEALRRAQVDALRRPGTQAPFFWAAFELIGDGR